MIATKEVLLKLDEIALNGEIGDRAVFAIRRQANGAP